jgi:hypothetical protein
VAIDPRHAERAAAGVVALVVDVAVDEPASVVCADVGVLVGVEPAVGRRQARGVLERVSSRT